MPYLQVGEKDITIDNKVFSTLNIVIDWKELNQVKDMFFDANRVYLPFNPTTIDEVNKYFYSNFEIIIK